MSYMIAVPDMFASSAAGDLASIVMLNEARPRLATTRLLPAAADEVSAHWWQLLAAMARKHENEIKHCCA